LIEYVLGIFLCWLAWHIGDNVKRGTATMMPETQDVRTFIWVTGTAALVVGIAAFFYGFLVFSWWLPPIAIILIPLAGVAFAMLGGLLSNAALSVPICGLAGVYLLWKTLL
jgi:hypothetical protein